MKLLDDYEIEDNSLSPEQRKKRQDKIRRLIEGNIIKHAEKNKGIVWVGGVPYNPNKTLLEECKK